MESIAGTCRRCCNNWPSIRTDAEPSSIGRAVALSLTGFCLCLKSGGAGDDEFVKHPGKMARILKADGKENAA